MSVRRSQFLAALIVVLVTLIPIACGTQQKAPSAAPQSEGVLNRDINTGVRLGAASPGVSITIPPPGTAPQIPADIPGGAPNATLTQAAQFAWQEFIAATWPAQPNPANGSYNRDVADPNGIYGATATSTAGAPLVWETFRHKVEIFPGTTSPSNVMLNTPPHGTNLGLPDYGYNDPPQYNYGTQVSLGNDSNGSPITGPAVTGPCTASDPNNATTAWVNADENSQIFLDTMYAGAAPQVGNQPTASQELLFLAKANRNHFMYSVNPANAGGTQLYQAFWNHSFGNGGTSDNPSYNAATKNFAIYQNAVLNGQQGTMTQPFIQFPAGTVEAKSAWRPLTTTEAGSGRFHMALVRTYHATGINGNQACWTQQPWGMLALHIIQKTPTAPYFIYATFSQADNIMNANGQPVEDADGNIINPPTQPSNGSALDSGISSQTQNPIAANLATPGSATSTAVGLETYNVQQAQCAPGSRLYLVNSAGSFTPQGPICVNARAHAIPPEIIGVNQAAHAAIQAYNTAYNGGSATPWLYYKLVNVQATPMNKTPGVLYTGPNAATFYQSNDVVETNYNLQFFSGRLVSESGGVLMSDYVDAASSTQPPTTPFQNVFDLSAGHTVPPTYNMGGCMGCHGNAQQAGDDFSFIMNVGRNDAPEPVPSPSMSMTAQAVATAAKIQKFHLPH
jgi:hypothetical protein